VGHILQGTADLAAGPNQCTSILVNNAPFPGAPLRYLADSASAGALGTNFTFSDSGQVTAIFRGSLTGFGGSEEFGWYNTATGAKTGEALLAAGAGAVVLWRQHPLDSSPGGLATLLKPGEEIGKEVHADRDQFFRVEMGKGEVVIDGQRNPIERNDAILVPAGARHNVINSGDKPLRLYTLYGPPNHRDGIVRATKAEAEASEEHFDGKTTE
jgi:quercetin dioxygenase-like cupin family protein